MRGEFEVPPGKGYVVGDMLVNGQPLNYGAQLAGVLSLRHTAAAKCLTQYRHHPRLDYRALLPAGVHAQAPLLLGATPGGGRGEDRVGRHGQQAGVAQDVEPCHSAWGRYVVCNVVSRTRTRSCTVGHRFRGPDAYVGQYVECVWLRKQMTEKNGTCLLHALQDIGRRLEPSWRHQVRQVNAGPK